MSVAVHTGFAFVDVRDSADAWVRVHVPAGHTLRVPAGCWCRTTHGPGASATVVAHAAEGATLDGPRCVLPVAPVCEGSLRAGE